VTFKPVLWFVKGHRRVLPSGRRPLMTDEFISPKKDKIAYAWAQGEVFVWVPIESLTDPGELIVESIRRHREVGKDRRSDGPALDRCRHRRRRQGDHPGGIGSMHRRLPPLRERERRPLYCE
jgi:hypothetical protein